MIYKLFLLQLNVLNELSELFSSCVKKLSFAVLHTGSCTEMIGLRAAEQR